MRKIDTIVLHHTACNNSFERIRADHIGRGWGDIFYHFVIDRYGNVRNGRGLNRIATRRRPTAIEISVIGRLHKEPILPEQYQTLLRLLSTLTDNHKITSFYNHRDLSATNCPGHLDIKKVMEDVRKMEELENKVKALEKQMAELLRWREDLRAFVHGTIMPEVRFFQELQAAVKERE